jgi:hypothetical protein
MDEGELLAAAQQIHDELGGTRLGAELARLIPEARAAQPAESRRRVIDNIYELLAEDDRARQRLSQLVAPAPGAFGGYEALAGDPLAGDDSFDRLVCPRGDYSWPVLDVADPTPQPAVCPHDGSPLVYQAAGEPASGAD